MAGKRASFIDKCFKAPNGKQGLWQTPNAPLIVWFVALILGKLLDGKPADFMQAVQFGAIFTWAWLEVFQGVSYFRRALGAVVLVLSVMSMMSKLG